VGKIPRGRITAANPSEKTFPSGQEAISTRIDFPSFLRGPRSRVTADNEAV